MYKEMEGKKRSVTTAKGHIAQGEWHSETLSEKPALISLLNQVGGSSGLLSQSSPELPGFKSRLHYLAVMTLGKLPACSKFSSL